MRPQELTHLDAAGAATMVDIGDKAETKRVAIAAGSVQMRADTLALIRAGNLKKGDVISVARIAGIMAAKRASDLIPLCHPIPLEKIALDFDLESDDCAVLIRATAQCSGKTGVEMEALTAVTVAALTIYDMAKAVDREMRLSDIRLLEKRGGAHGDFVAADAEA